MTRAGCESQRHDSRTNVPASGATFYYDVMSPYAYLSAARIDSVLPAATWQPVLLGGIFKHTGRSSWAVGDEQRRGRGGGAGGGGGGGGGGRGGPGRPRPAPPTAGCRPCAGRRAGRRRACRRCAS